MLKRYKQFFLDIKLLESYSIHDQTRINLLFNISVFVFVLSSLASIISVIIGSYPILIPALGNLVLSILVQFIMKYKDFVLAGKIYFSTLFLLLFGNLIFNYGTMHIGSPFWIMLLNICVFYVVGKKWGIVFLILSCITFSYYIIEILPIIVSLIAILPKATYYSAVYEALFVLTLLGYVINIILDSSKKSDELLQAQNEKLLLNNEEKTIMNKEIHHRVKNNLQVIISLMRIQMGELKNEEMHEKYQEMINRVLTMSNIHEKMYQSETLSKIGLNEYFQDLSKDLIDTYQLGFEVDLDFKFELENIGLKTIVPFALLFNELFSNSLKHAFINTDNPKIYLSVKKIDEKHFSFDYGDNGVWKKPSKSNSFGLELIETLTSQLDGEMKFEKTPYTLFKFKFNQLDF